MVRRLAVSEFPNDNPELHDGLVWACPAPCAPALPTLRLADIPNNPSTGKDFALAKAYEAALVTSK